MKKILLCLTFLGMGITLQNFAMEHQEDPTPQAPVINQLLTDASAEELAIENMDQLEKEIGWFNDSNTSIVTDRMNFLVQHFQQWRSWFSNSTLNRFIHVRTIYNTYMENPPQPNVPQAPNPSLNRVKKRLF